jgi:GDP-4-dehydro-6-deoxy-D-mannose reductase
MLKILITGINGFIGKHLASYLSSNGYEVYGISRSGSENSTFPTEVMPMSDVLKLSNFLQETNPDFIIHLAARAKPGRDLSEFEYQYEDTVRSTLNLARAIPLSVKLSLFVGSCEEYGNTPPPFKEETPVQCTSPYGWGKISAFYGVHMIARNRGFKMTWLRPFLTFGPGQESGPLVPTVINKALAGEQIFLTPAEQTRDLIYIKDLCNMFNVILQRPKLAEGQIFNLCSGEPRTVKDIVNTVLNEIGSGKAEFGAINYRSDEAMQFFGDPTKFNKVFGKLPLTDFSKAIQETIQKTKLNLSF